MKLRVNGIVIAQIVCAPTAREIFAIDPAGERVSSRQHVFQPEILEVTQLHPMFRQRHNPAHGGTKMTADGVVDLLDRIRREERSLI